MGIPINELKIGQVAQIKVRMPPYLVLGQTDQGTVFLTDQGAIETYESGFAEVKSKPVKRLLNLKSGVSHIYHNNIPICGHRNGQNTELQEVANVSCRACLRIAKGKF